VSVSCEHSNESSGYINECGFLDQLCGYHFSTRNLGNSNSNSNSNIDGDLMGCRSVSHFGCAATSGWDMVRSPSSPKMETLCSSDTLPHSENTTRRNNPQDHHLYSRCRQNFKPYSNSNNVIITVYFPLVGGGKIS
jgi:hypothetical protein